MMSFLERHTHAIKATGASVTATAATVFFLVWQNAAHEQRSFKHAAREFLCISIRRPELSIRHFRILANAGQRVAHESHIGYLRDRAAQALALNAADCPATTDRDGHIL